MPSTEEYQDGSPLRLDPAAASADPKLPAFLARPSGAPAYHGFPVLDGGTEGWKFGAITGYSSEEPADHGDAFVIAPDGRRAGIAWALDTPAFYEIIPADANRWGVYGLCFEKSVASDQDLVRELLRYFSQLRQQWEKSIGEAS